MIVTTFGVIIGGNKPRVWLMGLPVNRYVTFGLDIVHACLAKVAI